MEKNIIILGADMSLSVHTDSKNRDEAPNLNILLILHNQKKDLY